MNVIHNNTEQKLQGNTRSDSEREQQVSLNRNSNKEQNLQENTRKGSEEEKQVSCNKGLSKGQNLQGSTRKDSEEEKQWLKSSADLTGGYQNPFGKRTVSSINQWLK